MSNLFRVLSVFAMLALGTAAALGQFAVSSISPSMNALNVPKNTNITINFNEAVNAANINSSANYPNVIVTGSMSGRHSVQKEPYGFPTSSVTLNPDQDFLPGEVVNVTVVYDIMNGANTTSLGVTKRYSFTVAATGTGEGYFNGFDYFGSSAFPDNTTKQVYAVDYNHDGNVDIVSFRSPNAYDDRIDFLGKSPGSDAYVSGNPRQFAGGFKMKSLAFSDLNRDNAIDVIAIVAPGGSNITTAAVMLSGGYWDSPSTVYSYPNATFNTTNNTGGLIADVNNDGHDDFIVKNTGIYGVLPFSNSGYSSYSFTEGGSAILNTSSTDLLATDFNNDGYTDYAGANGDTVGVVLSTGWNSLGTKTVYHPLPGVNIIRFDAVGDVNGDGYLDIVLTTNQYDQSGYRMKNIVVLKNNGSGSFSVDSSYDLGTTPTKAMLADMDGDGDLDLVAADGGWIYVTSNNGSGKFTSYSKYNLNTYSYSYLKDFTVCDADGDGDMDVVYFESNSKEMRALRNSSIPTPNSSGYAMSTYSDYGVEIIQTWFQGSGKKVVVVMKQGSAVDFVPSNNATYPANANFGSGTDLGGGNFIVYNDSYYQSYMSAQITGLTPGATYYFKVFDYNGNFGKEKYNTTSNGTASHTTYATPNSPTLDAFTRNFGTSVRVNWTKGGGQGRIVVMKQGSAVDFTPSNNSTYTANAAFGSGTGVGGGNYVVFNGDNSGDQFVDVTGLSTGTTYYVAVFDYFGTAGSEIYGTPATGSVTTNSTAGIAYDTTRGTALYFDGNSQTYMATSTLPGTFTLEMWVKPSQTAVNQVFLALGEDSLTLGIDASDHFYAAHVNGSSPTLTITGTTTVASGEWYHAVLAAQSGGQMKLYINGIEEATASITEAAIAATDWYPGADYNWNSAFKGYMDEIRFWSAVRTPAEIRSTMHNTLPIGSDANLIAYWQFNTMESGKWVELKNNYVMNDWTSSDVSDVPVGGGSTFSAASFTSGTATLGNTSITTTDAFDNAVDVYASEISNSPAAAPGGTLIGNRYFIVNTFDGAPGSFSANLTLTFGPGVITEGMQSNPGKLILLKRNSNSAGAWTEVGGALAANAATGVVTWNGITSFSQFVVAMPPQYDTVAGYALNYNSHWDQTTNSFTLGNAFTVELWAKPASIGNQMVILVHGYDRMWIGIDATGKCFGRLTDDGAEGNITVTGTTTATANQWYHIALAGANGAPLKLYVNGELEATSEGNIGMVETSSSVFYPGGDYNNANYVGLLDELRLWSTVRTADQIRANMHKTLSGSQSNLAGYWQFNEGTGNTVVDLVQNNSIVPYDGSLVWTVSDAPVGGGTSTNASVAANATGLQTIGNVVINMTDGFDNPTDVVVSEITAAPNSFPTNFNSSVGSKYFIIDAFPYPDSGSFNCSLTLTFGPNAISEGTVASSLILYKRKSSSNGDWTSYGGASSVNIATGEVTWSNITSFSQAIVVNQNSAMPVELTSFKGEPFDKGVRLLWNTATELSCHGFDVERRTGKDWKKIGFVEGHGTSNSPRSYTFIDNQAFGQATYRLKQIDNDGTFAYSKEITVKTLISLVFELGQNYPNPFNPSTTISFKIPSDGLVSLKVYNVVGQEVATLVNEMREAGSYAVEFDASRLASGVYFSKLESGNKIQIKRMILLK